MSGCGCGGSSCTILKGDAGTPGSVWYTGAGVPSPSLGVVGDFYVDTVAPNTFYKKTATSTWTSQGTFQGATGATGAAGASVVYDDWTAVANGAGAGYVDLKTTTSAVPIVTNGNILDISTAFTLVPTTSPTIKLKLLFGSVCLRYNLSQFTMNFASGYNLFWGAKITRISDLVIRFESEILLQDINNTVLKQEKYFTITAAAVAVPSLTTGSIIKTQADGNGTNDVTCEFLKVISFKV